MRAPSGPKVPPPFIRYSLLAAADRIGASFMRIDAYTHFIPKKFFEAIEKIPGAGKDIGKPMRGVPCLYDLDERRRIVGLFPDYAQILSYPMPPLESFASGEQLDELCRLINDGFAEIVGK